MWIARHIWSGRLTSIVIIYCRFGVFHQTNRLVNSGKNCKSLHFLLLQLTSDFVYVLTMVIVFLLWFRSISEEKRETMGDDGGGGGTRCGNYGKHKKTTYTVLACSDSAIYWNHNSLFATIFAGCFALMQLCLHCDCNSTFHGTTNHRHLFHLCELWTAFRGCEWASVWACARLQIWNIQSITSKYEVVLFSLQWAAAAQWLTKLATMTATNCMQFIIELLLQNENVSFFPVPFACLLIMLRYCMLWHAFFAFRVRYFSFFPFLFLSFCLSDCGWTWTFELFFFFT